jgi:hypothetical protein
MGVRAGIQMAACVGEEMGLAWAAASVAGAGGAGRTGLDCAAESVGGEFWVFCAAAVSSSESTRADTHVSPNVIFRTTQYSPLRTRLSLARPHYASG